MSDTTPTTTAKAPPAVKAKYMDLYGEIMDKSKAKVGQLRRNINAGRSVEIKNMINLYGAHIEAKSKDARDRIQRHKADIAKLQAEHTKHVYKIQREMAEKQREKDAFFIDFIKGLDPKTSRRAQMEYHERFGVTM